MALFANILSGAGLRLVHTVGAPLGMTYAGGLGCCCCARALTLSRMAWHGTPRSLARHPDGLRRNVLLAAAMTLVQCVGFTLCAILPHSTDLYSLYQVVRYIPSSPWRTVVAPAVAQQLTHICVNGHALANAWERPRR